MKMVQLCGYYSGSAFLIQLFLVNLFGLRLFIGNSSN